jgi:hypothetical protein
LVRWADYDAKKEAMGTPMEKASAETVTITDKLSWVDSDLFRLVILHNYGGLYFDADVVLLRDFAPILGGEWLYAWGSSCNYANGAITSMKKGSDLVVRMLAMMATVRPRPASLDWGRNLYERVRKEMLAEGKEAFRIMPCCFFDASWLVSTMLLHVPKPDHWRGPFANHLHGIVWEDCIGEGEIIDTFSSWITERIRERIGGDIDELELPRPGGACKISTRKLPVKK